MPMKLGLELMPVISTYGFNSERKFINYVVNKINRTGLIVLLIDFQSSNARAIINCSLLKALNTLTALVVEEEKFNIPLYMMAWHFLFVTREFVS